MVVVVVKMVSALISNQATRYASQHKSVSVPSQDKLGGLRQEGPLVKNGGIIEVGAPLVRMGWRPPGLSVPLHALSSPAPQKSRRFS